MNKQQKINLSTLIAGIALILSIAGWAVKTTVSNMILEDKNEDLITKIEDYKNELRWCYRNSDDEGPSIPPYLLESPQSLEEVLENADQDDQNN